MARGARRLVESAALFGTRPVALLLQRAVALPDRLLCRLLLEDYVADLLEVLHALLLLRRLEEGDVGVVALLHVLVLALQDRVLGQGGHGGVLDHAEPAVLGEDRLGKVDTARNVRGRSSGGRQI